MSAERPKLNRSRCANCGKRLFQQDNGWRDAHKPWLHYGYAQRECYGLTAKYATPGEGNET